MAEPQNTVAIEEIINRVRPNHQTVECFNGGDNRDVVVVDGIEAFRFPKDEGGIEVGRFEFEALRLVQGKLSVAVPKPIELALDGSYNVQSFLPGKVLHKHEVTALPYEKRRDLGVAVAGVINELNSTVTKEDLATLPSGRTLIRNRDDYYAQIYETAIQQEGVYAATYRKSFQKIQQIRPNGSASNIIVFGDFSSPNLVLSEDDRLSGLIDWTELGLGDIHNELRVLFSVIGQSAYDEMVASIDSKIGPINGELVRLLAVIHELSILIKGKQKGNLTPERTELAKKSLNQWLDEGWSA